MANKLSAAQVGKIRRLSAPKELSPDEEGGELNIIPFLDIIVNILIFVLATVAVTFTSTIESRPPSAGGKGVRAEEKSLNLTVIIATEGFSIKASGGNVAPGCTAAGSGLAVPKRDGAYDFDGLTRCAELLKNASDEFKDETQVFLSANPGVDYQTVIGVIDAVRATPKGVELFPDVAFKVMR